MNESGTIVWRGICISCNQEWTMTQSEKDWWDAKLKREPGGVFPKRCRKCREIKRQQQERIPTIYDAIAKLEEMSMSAINDAYDDRGGFLAQELVDVVKLLEPYKGWRR